MGADKPTAKTDTAEDRIRLGGILIGTVVLLTIVAIFKKPEFSAESKAPALSPKEEAKLQKRLKEIDDSEQYALVARTDGWYPCLHNGKTTCYLLAGQVWKYGVTSKGMLGRYTIEFLDRTNVAYLVEFRGNMAECLKKEQIQIFHYPYLPENLARPLEDRLSKPPGNPIMR